MSVFANILKLLLEHGAPPTISPIKSWAWQKTTAKIYSKAVKQNIVYKQVITRMALKKFSCLNIV